MKDTGRRPASLPCSPAQRPREAGSSNLAPERVPHSPRPVPGGTSATRLEGHMPLWTELRMQGTRSSNSPVKTLPYAVTKGRHRSPLGPTPNRGLLREIKPFPRAASHSPSLLRARCSVPAPAPGAAGGHVGVASLGSWAPTPPHAPHPGKEIRGRVGPPPGLLTLIHTHSRTLWLSHLHSGPSVLLSRARADKAGPLVWLVRVSAEPQASSRRTLPAGWQRTDQRCVCVCGEVAALP